MAQIIVFQRFYGVVYISFAKQIITFAFFLKKKYFTNASFRKISLNLQSSQASLNKRFGRSLNKFHI